MAASQQRISAIYNSPNIKCPKCGLMIFKEAVILKKVSGLVSGSGKEELVPIPVYVCNDCGKIPQEFLDRPAAKQILRDDFNNEINKI